MKNSIIALLISVFSVTIVYSQDLAYSGGDSTQSRKTDRVRVQPELSTHPNMNNDKFIDNDGDGINDARCGRGMGLGKGLGKHNCVPENCIIKKERSKDNSTKENPGKAKGKNK
jgi:hypothetical protein